MHPYLYETQNKKLSCVAPKRICEKTKTNIKVLFLAEMNL